MTTETQALAQPATADHDEIELTDAQPQALVGAGDDFVNLTDPTRFKQLWQVAVLFARSKLVPDHFQNERENCFIAVQMAMRMKVDPFMFMQNCYIVYGRPGLEAKLAIALINSSGLFVDSLDYEIEGDKPKDPGYRVRAYATRKGTGRLVQGPWVDWDLVRSEGWDKPRGGRNGGREQPSKWTTMPGLMFQYRAAMFFGRLHCPERLMGMQTVDEIEDVGTKQVESRVVDPINRTMADMAARLTKEEAPANGNGQGKAKTSADVAMASQEKQPKAEKAKPAENAEKSTPPAAAPAPTAAATTATPAAEPAPAQASDTDTAPESTAEQESPEPPQEEPSEAPPVDTLADALGQDDWDDVKRVMYDAAKEAGVVKTRQEFEGGVMKYTKFKLGKFGKEKSITLAQRREMYHAIKESRFDFATGSITPAAKGVKGE